MTHVSLFTGIGGLDLAAEAAGFETVLQVEREPYALRILERHWQNVPRITDVREVHDDERWSRPTVVSGGFPCQPFSAAGKRRGADDDRYLWPELLRIVDEIRPSWVVGENVSGLLSIRDGMEIDDMLASLEARNYTPWVLHYPAAGVGAPHKRDRVFIVAHCQQSRRRPNKQKLPKRGRNMGECNKPNCLGSWEDIQFNWQTKKAGRPLAFEPRVHRADDGFSDWVDRLKALGNTVVPAQAYPIFAAIAEAEK